MAALMLPCFANSGGSSTAVAEPAVAQRSAAARKLFIIKLASSDHRGKKGSSAHFAGSAENLRRGPVFHDRALVHINDGIRYLARKAELVGHHHHRHSAAGKLLHDREHLSDQFGIERTGRFIEQHQHRLHGERARDRHPLLLPARKLRGIGIGFRREANAPQKLHRLPPRVLPLAALHLYRTFGDIFQRRLMREEIESLKYHAGLQPLPGDLLRGQAMQAPALFAQPQQFAIQPDAAAVDGRKLIDTTQKRRLARSRCPDQAKHLARPDVQRDPLESLKLPEILADRTDRDEGAGHRAICNEPRAKRRSSSIWEGVKIDTTSRYQKPATIRSSITREFA